jgi:hypothetical protein
MEMERRLPSDMVPDTVSVLEELPRTTTGQIDRVLLQDVAAGVGKLPAKKAVHAAAPALRTASASRVAQPAETGLPLSLSKHFKSPSRIDAVRLIAGRPGNLPFFLCPGGHGSWREVRGYQNLIRHLGDQRPLYGLVTADRDEAGKLYKNMDQLVAASLFAMRHIQPHGPYLLIGEGLGGKVAYEMARALEKGGEQVALLALWDAPAHRSGNWLQRLFSGLRRKPAGQGVHLAAYTLQSDKAPTHLAQRRYLEILKRFEPSERSHLPALALFSQQYAHHHRGWQKLLPAVKVAMVEGTHDNYLRVSGDKVVELLRQAIDNQVHAK